MILALLFLSFPTACSEKESDEPEEEFGTLASEITFGTARDAEQARGQWRHAEAAPDVSTPINVRKTQ